MVTVKAKEAEKMKGLNRSIDDLLETDVESKAELARYLGISARTLRGRLSGRSYWRWSEIVALASMAGKTVDEFSGYCKEP